MQQQLEDVIILLGCNLWNGLVFMDLDLGIVHMVPTGVTYWSITFHCFTVVSRLSIFGTKGNYSFRAPTSVNPTNI